MIIKFTSPTCMPCKQLNKFCDDNGIEIETYDISTLEGSLKAEEMGVMAVPTVFIDDEQFVGFTPELTEKLLSL